MILFEIVEKFLSGTPLWVWFLFAYLIYLGISLHKDGAVSIPKSFIFPTIFVLWGLERIFFEFKHSVAAFVTYLLFVLLGVLLGKRLYASFQRFYFQDGKLYRQGSWIPMVIIMLNFAVKYFLSAWMSLDVGLKNELCFNCFYAAASGVTIGLFIGGIINTVRVKESKEV